MQLIQHSYRGVSLLVQLSGDRVLVPLAILLSLLGAAAVGFELMTLQIPPANGVF
jgi:hypothetical protein